MENEVIELNLPPQFQNTTSITEYNTCKQLRITFTQILDIINMNGKIIQ